MERFAFTEASSGRSASLAYDSRGKGPALVYVHGWSCCRRDVDAVAELLAGSFRVVSVDLPHHGASTSEQPEWGITDFGRVVAALVAHLGLDDVTLLGHSMGSTVVTEAALLLGSSVRHVVALDGLTFMNVYPRQSEEVVEAVLAPFRADFAGTVRGFVDSVMPGADEAIKDRVFAEMSSGPQDSLVFALGSLLRWDMESALQRCSTPVTAVVSSLFLTDEARSVLSGRVEIVSVDLGGHFYFMERPDGSAEVLRDVLTRAR